MQDKCRLAGPVSAEQSHALAGFQMKIDAVDGLRAVGIAVPQATHLDDVHSAARIAMDAPMAANKNAASDMLQCPAANDGKRPLNPRASMA